MRMRLEDLKKLLIDKTPEQIIELLEIKSIPVDIKTLIRNNLDIKIDEKLEWNKLSLDGYVRIENEYPSIWLNNSLSEVRQNFVLAHELGHIVNDILPTETEQGDWKKSFEIN